MALLSATAIPPWLAQWMAVEWLLGRLACSASLRRCPSASSIHGETWTNACIACPARQSRRWRLCVAADRNTLAPPFLVWQRAGTGTGWLLVRVWPSGLTACLRCIAALAYHKYCPPCLTFLFFLSHPPQSSSSNRISTTLPFATRIHPSIHHHLTPHSSPPNNTTHTPSRCASLLSPLPSSPASSPLFPRSSPSPRSPTARFRLLLPPPACPQSLPHLLPLSHPSLPQLSLLLPSRSQLVSLSPP